MLRLSVSVVVLAAGLVADVVSPSGALAAGPSPVVSAVGGLQQVAVSPSGTVHALLTYAVNGTQSVEVTTDGSSWRTLASPTSLAIDSIAVSDAAEVYAIAPDTGQSQNRPPAVFWKYGVGGWSSGFTFANSNGAAAVATDGSQLVVFDRGLSGSGSQVWTSSDDGGSWSAQTALTSVQIGSSDTVQVFGASVHILTRSGIYTRWDFSSDSQAVSPVVLLPGGNQIHGLFAEPGSTAQLVAVGAASTGTTIATSSDRGTTWTPQALGDLVPAAFGQIAGVSMGSDGFLHYLSTTQRQVARSTVAAGAWSAVTSVGSIANANGDAEWAEASGAVEPLGFDMWTTAADPSGGNDVYWLQSVGDVVGEIAPSSSTTTPPLVATGLARSSLEAASPSRDYQVVLTSTSAGSAVLRSSDGVHWDSIAVPTTKQVTTLAVSNAGEVYLTANDSGAQTHTSPTDFWRLTADRWYGPSSYNGTFGDGTGQLAALQGGALLAAENPSIVGPPDLFYSTDDGDTWSDFGTLPNTGCSPGPFVVVDTTAALLCGQNFYRWSLTDFSRLSVAVPPASFSSGTLLAQPDARGTMWLASIEGASSSKLQVSTDDGNSWSVVDPGTPLPAAMANFTTAPGFGITSNDRLVVFDLAPDGSNDDVMRTDRALASGAHFSAPAVLDVVSPANAYPSVAVSSQAAMLPPGDVWVQSGAPTVELLHYGSLGLPAISGGPLAWQESAGPNAVELGCERCVADPVNTASGNLYEGATDLGVAGRGLALSWSRSYSSLVAASQTSPGALGYGWTDSYATSLSIDASTGDVTWSQPSGARTVFTAAGSSYTAAPRVLATLTHNTDGTFTLVARQRTTYDFDSSGRLVTEVDLNGYATRMAYYGSGRLSTVTDAQDRKLTITYNGAGRLASVTDDAGRSVGYAYDAAGNLQSVTDLAGGVTSFTYDGSHRMLTMLDPNQQGNAHPSPVTNHYDGSGRVDWQTDARGNKTTFSYSGDDFSTTGGTTTITDPLGNVTTDTYTSGVLMQVTKNPHTAQAATWAYSYDPNTLGLIQTIDPNGNLSTATFDSRGNRLTATDPLNRTTTWTYDSINDVLTVKDPAGVTTTNTYNSNGDLLTSSTPTSKGNVETQYFYDDAAHPGDLTRVIDPDGKTWRLGYDANGMLTSKTDPLGHGPSWSYDSVGRIVSSTTGENKTTLYVTDAFGRVTQTTDPLTHITRTVFDGNGNVTDTYDEKNRHTHTDYNADNQPILVTRNDGSTLATGYDADGNVMSQTDGALQPTTYSYDALNHLSRVTDPKNRATQYSFDPAGNLLVVTKPDGVTITRGYDAANELTSITYSDSTPAVSGIGYDADGRRTSMTDGTGTSTWGYDELGRLTSYTNGAHQNVRYGYDLAGHQTTITYPDGTVVTRTFDDTGRIAAIDDGHGHVSHFGYDHADGLTSTQYANGITATTVLDAMEQPATITDTTGTTTIATFGTTRWEDERLKTVSATGAITSSDSYGYTPLAQLGSTNAGNYGYDNADNLTTLIDGTQQFFDTANELTSTSRIQLIGATNGGDAGTTATASAAIPGGQRAGDLVLFAVTYPGSATVSSAPSGYTQVGTAATTGTGATNTTTVLYRRTTTAANETPPTLTFTLPTAKSAVLAVYRGVDGATPIDASGKNAQPSSTTLTLPGLTPALSGERVVTVFGAAGNATAQSWSRPPFTGEVQSKSDQPLTSLDLDEKTLLTGTAPTGAFTATFPNTPAVDLAGIDVLLKPAVTSYGYDANGNRTSLTPPGTGTSTYGYDAQNRLISYTGPGVTAAYTYDGTGLRASKTVNGGAAEVYLWDPSSSVPKLLVDGAVDVIYGPDGLPLEHYVAPPAISLVGTGSGGSAGGSTTTTITLPAHQRGDLILVAAVTTANSTVSAPAGFAAVANFTGASPNQVTQAPQETVFRRIADGTETSISLTSSQPVANSAVAAIYRSTDQDYPVDVVAAAATNASGTALNLNSVNARRTGELLVGIPAATGNVLPGTWTFGGGLTSRVQKSDNPLSNIALGDQTLTATGLTGIRPTSTDQSGQLIGISLTLAPAPDMLFYQHDQQGSTRVLTDQFARIRATYTYDPYGRLTSSTGTYGTLLRYTGEYNDPETNLYYLRARYYDPTTAQFLTRDPLETATLEAYSYVGDDPADNTDPSGMFCWGLCSFGNVWNDTGGKAVHFVDQHRKGIEIGAGVALGVAAAATGVGAVVEGATLAGVGLGAGSVTMGLGATALDYGPCTNKNDTAACLGLGLGVTGTVAGGFGLAGSGLAWTGIITEDSLTAGVLNGIGAFGWNVGIAGTVLDTTMGIASARMQC